MHPQEHFQYPTMAHIPQNFQTFHADNMMSHSYTYGTLKH